ncbi:hypothetical protein QJS10_CPA03g01773 [Acorus calamus]|uniref:Uncharacterized protein n=1 Tax=Acorus calamus TaxID=4465 RepID=A0AAV9FAF8_ACOCL|nr:hypothetical protein QJS10_CPA03g01773 [Acorus calamus]
MEQEEEKLHLALCLLMLVQGGTAAASTTNHRLSSPRRPQGQPPQALRCLDDHAVHFDNGSASKLLPVQANPQREQALPLRWRGWNDDASLLKMERSSATVVIVSACRLLRTPSSFAK